jgi:high-affinity Fe2+/Pb2+ permease
VTSDGVLTVLQVGTTLCAQSAIPIISMIVEIACAGAVTVLIYRTVRRASAMEIALR